MPSGPSILSRQPSRTAICTVAARSTTKPCWSTNLATFIALKRANARLNRDVIFLATDDEEQGGDASIKILIAKYWDKIAAGFALNEGGNVVLENGKVQYVAVQASEKVAVNVTVVARGTSGHASMPIKDNPVVHLSAAVEKIGAYVAPVHFTTIVRRYFEGLGRRSKAMKSPNGCALSTPPIAVNTRNA